MTKVLQRPDKCRKTLRQSDYMKATISTEAPSCVIAGHHFVQRGKTWVDTEVEKKPDARRIRVRFDSLEFFELLIKYPKALPYVTVNRNVALALDDTVYEIYE
jgi:hypothetical protein